MNTPRKICVVTGSRAEYGLLYWVIREIERKVGLQLQLVVTGMHLSPEFGMTIQQIASDGFPITRRVEALLSSDSAVGITKSTGLGMIGFADVFQELNPDIVLMLGDRFELLAAASSALFAALPIAHIHGGEVTVGAFDEAIRHSITKMSHLHFTSTESHRNRVIQLGEHPSKVFNVGAPGLDNIRRMELLSKKEVEDFLGVRMCHRSLLVTWHPATLEPGKTKNNFQSLLDAMDELEDTTLIFTKANADTEGRIVNAMIDKFVIDRENAVAHTSLGQLYYLSTLKHVNGVVGNSSSGIIEAPSLFIGTVNIGDRQKGREKADSVIDCSTDRQSILAAISKNFSRSFQENISLTNNPYDSGSDVARSIVDTLLACSLRDIVKKSFYDLATSRSS